MEISGLKRDVLLPILAAFSVNACTAEHGHSREAEMTAALIELEKETGDLVVEFETAASKALANGQTFEEVGNQSGEAVLVNEPYSFGCIKSNAGKGTLCEKAKLKSLTTNPNLVYLDRDDSSIVTVGDDDTDLQVIKKDASGQDSATMFLAENHCGINEIKKGVSSSEDSNNPEIIKRCATLRDSLRARFVKVMSIATGLKNKN